MKKLIALLVAAGFVMPAMAVETKQVCRDVKNAKTGKIVNQCKTIKVHKKFEGTKMSDVKPVVQPKPVKKAAPKRSKYKPRKGLDLYVVL